MHIFSDKKLLLVLVIVFATFANSTGFEFINWDDSIGIYENEIVKNFKALKMFTTNGPDYYRPLSVLSFGIDYLLFKDNANWFHFVNILWHLLNCVLVFKLLQKFKVELGFIYFAVLLFAVHPLRVESVVWVTARKDLMYTSFYILALINYIQWINENNENSKSKTFIFTILAILSKSSAIVLPATFILTNFYFNQNKKIIDRIKPIAPIIIIAFIFGIKILFNNNNVTVSNNTHPFDIGNRILIACYSINYYFTSFFAPFGQSPLHVFPNKLSSIYFYSPAVSILIVGAVYLINTKLIKKNNELFIFGFVFFALNVLLISNILPVSGWTVVAERHSYLSSIGIILMLYVVIQNFNISFDKIKYLLVPIIGIFIVKIYFENLTYENSIQFWNKVLSENKDFYVGYNQRSLAYKQKGNYTEALKDLNSAISLNPQGSMEYTNRGNLYYLLNNKVLAIKDYEKALELNPNNFTAQKNLKYCKSLQ